MSEGPDPSASTARRGHLIETAVWVVALLSPIVVGQTHPGWGALVALCGLAYWLTSAPLFRGLARFYGAFALLTGLVWQTVSWLRAG